MKETQIDQILCTLIIHSYYNTRLLLTSKAVATHSVIHTAVTMGRNLESNSNGNPKHGIILL